MPRLEKQVIHELSTYLKGLRECWFMKVHGSGFQQAGVPDIIGVRRGRFFAIEAKAENGRVSRIQEYIIGKLRDAGAVCVVARSLDDILREAPEIFAP